MTVFVSNTALEDNLDTFRLNTNFAATIIGNNVVTVTKTGAARGGYSVGNGHVEGTFSVSNLRTSSLAGGNTSSESSLEIISNTEIKGTSLTISANTSFSGNVDFSGITGTNRLFLPDSSRIRLTGGQSGQYIKISNQNQLGFSFIRFRDFNELQTNTLPIILSGANTSASFEGSVDNSPPVIFKTSGPEEARIFLADSGTFNQAYLVTRLTDAGGLSAWQLRNSSNTLLHTMSSDGDVTLNASQLASSVTIKSDTGNIVVFDGDTNLALFNGAILANSTVEFNQAVTAYGDVTLGSDQNDDVNIRGRLLLNDQELLGGASGFTFAGDVNMQSNTTVGTDSNDLLLIKATVGNTVFGDNVTLGSSSSDEVLVNATMRYNADALPNTDDAFDLGSSTNEWKDLYIDGVANIDELNVATGASQGVSSSLIPKTTTSFNLGSATRAWGTVYSTTLNTGSATVTNNLGVNGVTTLKAVNSGNTAITGSLTVSGGATIGTVQMDAVNASQDSTFGANVQIDGSLNVDGDVTIAGNLTFGNSQTDTFTVEGQFANAYIVDLGAHDLRVYGNTSLGNHLTDKIELVGTVTGLTSNGTVSLNGPVFLNDEVVVQGHFANQQTTGMANFQKVIVDSTGTWQGTLDDADYPFQVNTKSMFKDDVDVTNINVAGTLSVTGSFVLPSNVEIAQANGLFTESLRALGAVVLGDQPQDELTINATIQSDIIPKLNVDIGSETNHWDNVYANNAYIRNSLNFNNRSGLSIEVINASGELNSSMIPDGSITSEHLSSTTVVAGTYGNSAAVASFTVDEDGRITAASNIAVAGVSSFSFNDANNTLTLGTSSGDVFEADIGALEVTDGSITTAKLATLAGLTGGQYGSASEIPVVTINNKGQVTAISTASVAGVTDLTYYQANSTLQLDTADGSSIFTTISDVTATQKGIAKFDTGQFDIASGSVSLKNATSGAVLAVSGTSNEIEVSRVSGTVTVGLPDRVQITDDLQVTNDVTSGSLQTTLGALIGTDLSVGGDASVTGETTLGNTQINGTLATTSNVTVGQNLIVSGNLTVQGTTTTLNTSELTVEDNIITLASGQTSGSVDAGIEVDRGSDTDVFVKWNETADKWQAHDGTSVRDIAYADQIPTADDDTKYDIQAIATTGGAKIQLTANGSATNVDGEVTVLGSGSTTVSRSGDTITVSSTDTDTVTRIGDASTKDSGDITIQGGGATAVSYNSGTKTFTISSTDTNTDTNDYVDGVSFAANVLTLTRTGALSDLTVDLSSLSSPTPSLQSVTDVGSSTTATITAGAFNGSVSLSLTRAGESVLTASTSEIVINEGSLDRNFRVESDLNLNMLFVDAGLNRIGVGKNNPAETLDVNGNVAATRFKGALDWDFIDGNKPSAFTFNVSDTDNTSTVIDSGETVKFSGSDGVEVDLNGSLNTFTLGLSTTANYQFGSVGVGTSASGTAGMIRATNDIIAYYSDERLKDMQGTIPDALAKVNSLNGYYYTENELAKELGYDNDARQVGVSAQEVEAVMPEVVKDAPIDAEYKTVQYEKLVPLLIEAIKELSAEIDELKKNK